MSGSGNAIIVLAPKVSKPSCDRLRALFEKNKDIVKVIETSFITADTEPQGEDATS
jgi:hypothetical protein